MVEWNRKQVGQTGVGVPVVETVSASKICTIFTHFIKFWCGLVVTILTIYFRIAAQSYAIVSGPLMQH